MLRHYMLMYVYQNTPYTLTLINVQALKPNKV